MIHKPWGYYEDYFRSHQVVFKKIVINPGHKISYQVHEKRSELWFIVSGRGQFRFSNALQEDALLAYSTSILEAGQSVEIPANMAHQLICLGDEPLVLYEMQFGIETVEEDILRLEDSYGRN